MANAAKSQPPWQVRDIFVAFCLFASTSAIVWWQATRLMVVWDLSYVLDTAARIASGQMPYRDFPLAHAPLTFLVQALLMHLFGRVYWHHAVYAACIGGFGTVLAWRVLRHIVQGWWVAVLLAAPLCVLGICCILPLPFYDCDCAFWMLVSIFLLQRAACGRWVALAAGAAMVVPVFTKQNMGLPYFAAAFAGVLAMWVWRRVHREPDEESLGWGLIGALGALALVLVALQATAGLGNYVHWTVQFAAQRRMPGLGSMLEVYQEPSLLWTLPCLAAGVFLLSGPWRAKTWAHWGAGLLLAAPFVWMIWQVLATDDVEDRASFLLAVWPLLLIAAAVLAVWRLRHGLSLQAVIPVIVLGAVNGTLLSQQLWGSTYAIWPLLLVLVAGMLAWLEALDRPRIVLSLAAAIAATLGVCGWLYIASAERLSYADVLSGPAQPATLPQLAGLTVHGDYLPAFEELLRFAAKEIPPHDGLILLPGEDPFYFATGRKPQFPVLLFDPATDPLSPEQTVAEAKRLGIRWLIVKRKLQIKDDPMPNRDETMELLEQQFTLYRKLANYDVYQRK